KAFGAPVGQAAGAQRGVGSSGRLAHGRFATATAAAAEASLDAADELDGHAETHADLDVGALATFRRVRIGFAVKHVTEPSFHSAAGERVDLSRQARVGLSGRPSARPALVVAVAADLTRTATAAGDAPHAA